MKLFTLNFLTCATRDCRAAASASGTAQGTARGFSAQALASAEPQASASADSHEQGEAEGEQQGEEAESNRPRGPPIPLHLSDVELVRVELEFNPVFWRNVIPRLDLRALGVVLGEAGVILPAEVVRLVDGGGGEEMEGVEGGGS